VLKRRVCIKGTPTVTEGETLQHLAVTHSLTSQAFQTWCYELATIGLTAIYCAIAFYDINKGAATLTSTSWFSSGFCVWEGHGFTSHTLCVIGDLLVGGALFLGSFRRHQKECRARAKGCLRLGMAEAAFTMFHGLGHLFIGQVLEKDFMNSVRPAVLPAHLLVGYYILLVAFLALGPYLGARNGVAPVVCVTAHLISIYAFMLYVPNQFAFGAVQLILNSWYCIPRVLFLGWKDPSDVAKRVHDGWDVVSKGFLLLMPIVFAEMLACDMVFMACGGHFVYDGMILLISTWYSVVIWRQCDSA